MSLVSKTGAQVKPEGAIVLDRKGNERLRVMTAVHLQQRGWSERSIGTFLNTSARTVRRRLEAIPPDVRKHLEAQGSEFFGDLFEEEADVIVYESDHSQAVTTTRTDIDDSPETVERLVDLLALALHDLGLNPRRVGHVVGLAATEAERRIQEIPDEVRAYARSAGGEPWEGRPQAGEEPR